ncbi:MAG: LysR family transcriptional regulator [Bacteroidota bacterium]
MNYTLHQLQIFKEVVQQGSITKASEVLNLTQPAVSIQLKNLEDQFGIPLTEKVGRGIHITAFGLKMAEVFDRILLANDEVKHTINRHKGLLAGDIHIAVVSTGKYVMPYLLSGFVAKHPEVKVTMDVTNKTQVVRSLEENKTDFALVSVLPERIKLNIVPLMENHLFLVGNKERAESFSYEKSVKASLESLPMIFREQGSATRAAMETYFNDNKIPHPRTLYLTSNEAVKQAVNAGLGYSIMPLIGLRNELKSVDLKLIPMKGLPIITQWMLVYRKEKGLSPASQAFLNFIEQDKGDIINKYFSWTKDILRQIEP